MQRLPTQEPIGLLVATVRRRIKQAVGALVRPYDLSPQQFWVIIGIAEREGLAMRELGQRHPIDAPTASRIVNALVGRGLLHVETDPADRRRSRLLLTPKGAALAAELLPLAARVRAATEAGLSPEERAAAAGMLRKIIANMEGFRAELRARKKPRSGPEPTAR